MQSRLGLALTKYKKIKYKIQKKYRIFFINYIKYTDMN